MARRTGLPAVEVLDACESTNDEALRRARAGAPHGAAVAAVRQTLGRGDAVSRRHRAARGRVGRGAMEARFGRAARARAGRVPLQPPWPWGRGLSRHPRRRRRGAGHVPLRRRNRACGAGACGRRHAVACTGAGVAEAARALGRARRPSAPLSSRWALVPAATSVCVIYLQQCKGLRKGPDVWAPCAQCVCTGAISPFSKLYVDTSTCVAKREIVRQAN